MPKAKGRSWQFADDAPVKDYDPEDEAPSDSDAGSGSDDSDDKKAATDHYVSVGKSKLRRKGGPAPLGPKYQGARVSRADLDAESDGSDSDGGGSGAGGSDDFEDAREQPDGDEDDDDDDGSGDSVYADPDNADLDADDDGEDAEIDSDDALGESDKERFSGFTFRGSSKPTPQKGKRAKRPTAADYMASSEEDNDSETGSGDEEQEGLIDDEAEESEEDGLANDSEDDEDDEDDDAEEDDSMDGFIADSNEEDEDSDEDDSESDEDSDGEPQKTSADSRAAIKGFLNSGERSVAGSLSSAAEKDVAKGKAVREQQKKFDAVLNIRIRLQKSLVAVNSLHTVEEPEHQSEPYEAAEAAALKLWNALDGFRASIGAADPAKAGQKRKRADASTSSQDLWESMQGLERRSVARRKAVLENWSQKARNMRMTDASSRGKFGGGGGGGQETSLTDKLGRELEDPERLVRRTRTPRSCAPAQVARKVNEDAGIYDDADFYQLLLKELVDQRSADTMAGSGAAATVRFAAAAATKEAKAKKHVDTRASKGRKMRFNVHDKLQNFMAPEDRRSWEQSAIDRLFGTLFGQKMRLDEDEGGASDEDDDMMADGGAEEAGLRLFRS